MTDKNMELTRRQILGSAGVVGLAGAGAGLGTSALFNDEETFENNTVTAGNFSLKVDWEEHYSYPQIYDEFEDPTSGLDFEVHREDPDDSAYVGFPDPENPMVWIHEDDLNIYMRNTSIEAFPDPNDNGQQGDQEDDFEYVPCEDGAWLDEHLDPTEGYRTANADTEGLAPLVDLEDVKPGDFGELTLSFHLCDNPGYVWLRGNEVENAENGYTEPEPETVEGGDANDPGDPDGEGELAENIETAWWYDTDGNNIIDSSIGEVDVMVAVDTSASLNEFGEGVGPLEDAANDLADNLDAQADARIGGLTFANSVDDFTALADSPVEFSGLEAGGGTAMPAALEIAAAELDANGRPDAETFIVLLTDGGPNYETGIEHSLGGHTAGPYSGGNTNWNVVQDGELDETADIADGIRDAHRILTVGINDDRPPEGRTESGAGLLSAYLRGEIAGGASDYFSAEDPNTVSNVLDAIIDAIAMPEEVFHRGTLADDLDMLSSGEGIPLDADLPTEYDEIIEGEPADGEDEDRECFDPGVTNYVGFAWWLPTDVGNEVQSDSVSFDLGFYAEQCRNNDGSGPVA